MMNLINYIENVLSALDEYEIKYNISSDNWTTNVIRKVMIAFKESEKIEENLNIRLLRAMKDVYVVSFRNFEGTELHNTIKKINNQLSLLYKSYNDLEPLGMDFGKGNPI